MSGMYEGFEGFRSPTVELQREAVGSWLVVLDTNVLLSLYNFQGAGLDDFIKVFEALEDRLFVPHQVIDEFWRNRRTVLAENRGRHRERETAEEGFSQIEHALRRWHQRVVDRTTSPPGEVLDGLRTARSLVLGLMDTKNSEAEVVGPDTPTQEDGVLRRLEPLLERRVGASPSPGERAELLKRAQARITARTPPGYLDAAKSPERAAGDFLVWHQAMEESKRRQQPLLLVTQDQKEDWWADRGSPSMRARPELVAELLEHAGQRLLMMRSHDLLGLSDVLGITVRSTTLDEAEAASDEPEDIDDGPVVSPLGLLYREFWTQFSVFAKDRGWTSASPPTVNWWSMPAGGGGNSWSVSFAMFGCRSELYLGHKERAVNLHRLHLLQDRSEEIQLAFGTDHQIVFDELPGAQSCRVDVRIDDGRRVSDRTRWAETLEFMVDTQDRLRAAIDAVGGVPRSLPG